MCGTGSGRAGAPTGWCLGRERFGQAPSSERLSCEPGAWKSWQRTRGPQGFLTGQARESEARTFSCPTQGQGLLSLDRVNSPQLSAVVAKACSGLRATWAAVENVGPEVQK